MAEKTPIPIGAPRAFRVARENAWPAAAEAPLPAGAHGTRRAARVTRATASAKAPGSPELLVRPRPLAPPPPQGPTGAPWPQELLGPSAPPGPRGPRGPPRRPKVAKPAVAVRAAIQRFRSLLLHGPRGRAPRYSCFARRRGRIDLRHLVQLAYRAGQPPSARVCAKVIRFTSTETLKAILFTPSSRPRDGPLVCH